MYAQNYPAYPTLTVSNVKTNLFEFRQREWLMYVIFHFRSCLNYGEYILRNDATALEVPLHCTDYTNCTLFFQAIFKSLKTL